MQAYFRLLRTVGATMLSGYADKVIWLKRLQRKIRIGILQPLGQKTTAHPEDFQLLIWPGLCLRSL